MLAAAAGTAQAAGATTIDHFRSYDLRALGYGTLSVPVAGPHPFTSADITYTLPAGTRERAGHWFLMHLHFRLVLAKDTGDGTAYVSSESNRYASTQVKVSVFSNGSKAPTAVADTTGLLTGPVSKTFAGGVVDMRYANYFPYRAVRPGVNRVSFRLERFGDVKLKRLEILPDTAIEYTAVDPAKLELQVNVNRPTLHVGESAILTVEMRNSGSRPLRRVGLTLVRFGSAFSVAGRTTRTREVLAPGQIAFESFRIRARSSGVVPVIVSGSSSANRPAVEVTLHVRPGATATAAQSRSAAPGTAAWKIALAALVAAVLVGVAALQLRRF